MTQKRAAHNLEGIVMCPPMTVDAASGILGQEISLDAWAKIETAYRIFGHGLDDLSASRLSRKKGDPSGWFAQQEATAKDLETAMGRLKRVMARPLFLAEAAENYSLQTFGYSHIDGLDRELGEAYKTILNALTVIERATPLEVEVKSEAELKGYLVRSVHAALKDAGVDVSVSDGWTLEGNPEGVALADLTGFEQLVEALGIHDTGDDGKLSAFARWLRRALGQA